MRRVLFISLAILLLTLVSCTGPSIKLDKKWKPLTEVREGWLTSDRMYVISNVLYVSDLEEWNSIKNHDRQLVHERVHAWRQTKQGTICFLVQYTLDTSFRWKEEFLATYAEMQFLKNQGREMNLEDEAKFLSGPSYFYMISKEEALQELKKAWDGEWKPSPGDLPEDSNESN